MISNFNYINPFAARINPSPEITGAKREDIVVEVGASNVIVDGIRNILSIPYKIMLLNNNIGSGNISADVIEKVKDYLHKNGLHDVEVSANQYKPQSVWYRTLTNPKTSLISKLFLGIPNAAGYTISIPKLTAQMPDSYDTFSNTVFLSTNELSAALHECGHAKDFNSKENPGLYHLVCKLIPGGILYAEYQASNNAIQYLRQEGDTAELKRAYTYLPVAYATYVESFAFPIIASLGTYVSASNYFSLGNWIPSASRDDYQVASIIAAIAIGHLVGRVMASYVEEKKVAESDANTI